MSNEEIGKKFNCNTKKELRKIYKNNSDENIEQFYKRIKI